MELILLHSVGYSVKNIATFDIFKIMFKNHCFVLISPFLMTKYTSSFLDILKIQKGEKNTKISGCFEAVGGRISEKTFV